MSITFISFLSFCLMITTDARFLNAKRLVGLVVKASASRAEEPGFDSRLLRWDFSGWRHTSDLKSNALLATV